MTVSPPIAWFDLLPYIRDNVAIIVTDFAADRILLANQSAEQLFGSTVQGSLADQPIDCLIQPRDYEQYREMRARFLESPRGRFEYRNHQPQSPLQTRRRQLLPFTVIRSV